MDAANKFAGRLLEWFRNHSQEEGIRVFDDDNGVSIGVEGHVNVERLAAFLLHGNATHTPGPSPELVGSPIQHEPDAR